MTKLKPYTDLANTYDGETAFIVGSGISISYLDLTPIHDYVVYTVNAGILLMPWGEGDYKDRYWISNDSLCRKWDWWSKLKNSNCTKIVRNSWNKYFDEIPDFYEFYPRPTSEGVVNYDDIGLSYCSSIPSALDLSLQMGCKKIFLLGVDQYFRSRVSHFWQLWDTKKQPKRIDNARMAPLSGQRYAFGFNDKAYSALKKFADHLGAKVYNCNISSRVNVFEKITYEKALDLC